MRCLPGAEISPEGLWPGEGMGCCGTALLAIPSLGGGHQGAPACAGNLAFFKVLPKKRRDPSFPSG